MNQLSSINILQEYAVQNKMGMPKYDYQDITKPSTPSKFICYCSFNNKTIEVTDSSKKAAKHRVAKLMLDYIKYSTMDSKNSAIQQTHNITNLSNINKTFNTSVSLNSPTTSASRIKPATPRAEENYVCMLNEYCSKHKQDYPKYYGMGVQDNKSVVQCIHKSLYTFGYGSNKKEAKQNSASKIIWKNSPRTNQQSDLKNSVGMESKDFNIYTDDEINNKGMALSINNNLHLRQGSCDINKSTVGKEKIILQQNIKEENALKEEQIGLCIEKLLGITSGEHNNNKIAEEMEKLCIIKNEVPETSSSLLFPDKVEVTENTKKFSNLSGSARLEKVSENVKMEYSEELKQKLYKAGINFTITCLTDNPVVLMLTVTSGMLKGGNHYIETGNVYEKVLEKLLEQTIEHI